jgi:hypothetical protein
MADRYWDWADRARAPGRIGDRAPSPAAIGRYIDAVVAASHRATDVRNGGDGDCACHDHCNGIAGSEQCNRREDSDRPAARDGITVDATCNASTTYRLADFCCGDPSDCSCPGNGETEE